MEVLTTKSALRARLDAARADGHTVGLVPTMGALHDGHLSLIAVAAAECDVVALTIFVNPLQFGAGEDLDAYPRPLERDLELAAGAGASMAFTPSTDEMYPTPTATTVHVDGLSASMEGASRPTHFDGVTTVVTKLFNAAGPCRAYFGEKDFQQLAVVRRMVADLDQPVTVVGCPIVREPDGLARSSRNVYLTPAERQVAPALHRALELGARMVEGGERDPAAIVERIAGVVHDSPPFELDYAEVVDSATLERPEQLVPGAEVRLLVAARLGTPRLIDNLGVLVP
ncbi:MAG TPA: pantoate--beta-alanine ligase [Acidimicrobiales bacterium]